MAAGKKICALAAVCVLLAACTEAVLNTDRYARVAVALSSLRKGGEAAAAARDGRRDLAVRRRNPPL